MTDAAETSLYPPELLDALADRSVVLFVGAGMSMNSDLPDWYTLVEPLAERSQFDLHPRAYVTSEHLLDAVQHFINDRAGNEYELHRHLQSELDTTHKPPSHAHECLARLHVTNCFTANFDNLLERAYQDAGRTCKPVVRDTDISLMLDGADDANVIKLYGDLQAPDTLILSKGSYERFEQQKPAMLAELRRALRRRTMLYIGWSHGDFYFNLAFGEVLAGQGGLQRTGYSVMFGLSDSQRLEFGRKNIVPIILDASNGHRQAIEEWLCGLTARTGTVGTGPKTRSKPYIPPPLPDLDENGRPPTQHTAPLPPGSRLPYQPNPFFTGRETELGDLALALLYGDATEGERGGVAPTMVVSTGIGGVGKTQLAAEFAHRWGRFFHGVHWVSLANPETAAEEVAACGLDMGLGAAFSELPLDDRVAAVRRVWAGPERRLLLFDNCEDPALLRKWRPSSGGCVLLVTSRRESWPPSLGVRTRHLDPFDVPESVALLRKHLEDGDGRPPRADLPDEQLAAIARELGELPLALRLTGGYLRRYRRESAADFLTALQQPDLLAHAALLGEWAEGSTTDHDLSVARTFAVSFEQLRPDDDATDAAARDLLARAACFAPGEPLPDELLLATLATEPPTLADDGLERLLALGLLERTGPESVRLHRLLARYVAGELAADEGQEDVIAATQAAVEDTVQTILDEIWETQVPLSLTGRVTHLTFVVEEALKREDERAATLANDLAICLEISGDYGAARPLYQRALAIREAALGPEHPGVASILNNLAGLLKAQGDYGAARQLYERSLAIDGKALGPEHPDVGVGYGNLAGVHEAMGAYSEALPLRERAVEIHENALGPEHPYVATGLNNLALLLKAQGDYGAARPLYERALAIDEKVYGPDHPDVATDLNNLAELHRAQGDYGAARPLYERALAIKEAALGPAHPSLATSLNNLAGLHRAQGDYGAARPLFERALAIQEAALGPEHPDVATTLNNLALLHYAQGNYGAARPLYERALAIWEAALGPEHPDVAQSLNNLALLLEAQGEYGAARPLYERALAIDEKVLGTNHPNTAIRYVNLGTLLVQQGEREAGLAMLQKAVAVFTNVLGPEHPYTQTALGHLRAAEDSG